MSNSTLLAFLFVAGALTPGAALGQGAMELAIAGPQPHFVAAWAPRKEREAERSAVLAERVSLELRGVSLDAALKALTNRAGLRITYSRAVLPAGKRVTISARDVAVVTAMTEMLFRSGLDVVVDRDGALALVVCRHPPAPLEAEVQDTGTVVGRVTDKGTGAALVGATVVVEGTERSATTDADGRYRVDRVEAGEHTVRARYIGYTSLSTSATITAGREETVDFGLVKSIQKLDELVTVTPGGMQTEVRALPTPVTVITADDIGQQRPQALLDVIRQAVPTAVAFDNTNAGPVQTIFSVRGVNSLTAGNSNMKIYVDGVEASLFGLSAVDPASIGRIEVIRGPQASTVYGADAAGGVVQIFTKRGDPSLTRPEVAVEAQAGIMQTPYAGFRGVLRQQYGGSLRGGGANVTYNFGGGYTRLANWLPGGVTSRQVTRPSVYGGMRYARGIVTVDLSARYFRNNLPVELNPELQASGFVPESRPTFVVNDFTNETYGARIALAPNGWWRHQLTLGADNSRFDNVQTQRRLTTPSDTFFTLGDFANRKVSVGYNTSVTRTSSTDIGGSLTVGIDHYRLEASSFFAFQALNTEGAIQTSPPGLLFQNRATVRNTGYFAQAEASWREAFFLTMGLRGDANSAFGEDLGTPTSPRIGLTLVRPVGQMTLKLRGAYGRAIRAPVPGLAFGSVGPNGTTLANPLLAPERQRGWDAGVDLLFGSAVSLSVTGYDQIADNLIVYVQVGSTPVPAFQNVNIGRVTNRGVEVEATLALRPLQVKAQYGYVRSRIEDLGPTPGSFLQVGDEPRQTPAHTAGASLTGTPREGTTLSAGLTYVSGFRNFDVLAQFRCFGGTGPCQPTLRDYLVTYPGFAKVNLAATQRLTRQLDGIVSVDNLTNNLAYEGTNGNPVMGRITMVGLHFRF